VSKGGADRDNLHEGLKAKGRSRRESARRGAEASLASPCRRNDLLPALKIESCPLDSLKMQDDDCASRTPPIYARSQTRLAPSGLTCRCFSARTTL
jgi:hypothetical protein